jgi:histidine triad (HIT) family protein
MSEEITIFEKILSGEIPCQSVYEDEYTFAFDDIQPQAPVHVLVIPKQKLLNVAQAQEKDITLLGHLLWAAKKVADIKGLNKGGYRLVMNNGSDAGQSVSYLHCHVLGGRSLAWPPG